jgi:uncharacterized membrane protein YbhN (UPF0104 family)
MQGAAALLTAPVRPAGPALFRPPARVAARTVWAWAKVLGGAGIVALLMWRLGTGAFLDGLRVVNGVTLLAAFGIGLLTTVFSAWRWCLVARGLGIRLPLRAAVADYYRALFLNAALPGGVLGDVHRAVRHGKDVGDVGRGVRAVVLERFAGQVVLVTVGVAVLLTYPSPVLSYLRLAATPLVAAAVAAGGLAVALFAWTRLRDNAARDNAALDSPSWDGASQDGALPDSGASRWRRARRTAVSDLRLGLLGRKVWPGILLASGVALAGHLATFLVAARAAGSSAPVTRLAPLMLLALLAMALPVNIGGWGPREGVTAWAFGAAGLSATQGLTIAVAYGVFAFVASLPGAVVLLVRWVNRRQAAPKRSDRA